LKAYSFEGSSKHKNKEGVIQFILYSEEIQEEVIIVTKKGDI